MKKIFSLLCALCMLCALASFSSASAPTPVPYRQGDVSGDGQVDSTDARMMLQHEVGLLTLSAELVLKGDQDFNGVVDSTDARMVLQKEVGLWAPKAWTEAASGEPEGTEVEFRVVGYTLLSPGSDVFPFKLYVARSLDELKAIYMNDPLTKNTLDWKKNYILGVDDSLFEDQVVIVIWHVINDYQPRTIVDSIVKNRDRLILDTTTERPFEGSPLFASWRILLAVNRVDFNGVRTLQWENTSIQRGEEPAPYTVKEWLNAWLDSKNYIKREGDVF